MGKRSGRFSQGKGLAKRSMIRTQGNFEGRDWSEIFRHGEVVFFSKYFSNSQDKKNCFFLFDCLWSSNIIKKMQHLETNNFQCVQKTCQLDSQVFIFVYLWLWWPKAHRRQRKIRHFSSYSFKIALEIGQTRNVFIGINTCLSLKDISLCFCFFKFHSI